ncbi:MAG TPA: substrate-binding domain-containing protein [Ignavibacteriaceae bacterium]|nr:substrate-binding domain-containing protein [Ignavibacteriaceae bacterium]
MKNSLLKSLIFLSFLLINLSCKDTVNSPEETVDISHFTVENFPRVDGSTSNRPMMVVIACEIFGLSYKWYDAMDGTMQPYPEDNPEKPEEVEFVRNIYFYKTIQAYNRLIYDSTDVILVANEPSEDQLTLASSVGVSFSTSAIALDGLVFIVNSENPVQDLSHDQIIGIFTGSITNWKDAGGNDAEISVYTRNVNSGSQELMKKIVMQGRPMIEGQPILSMMGLLEQLASDENGIGYTVYFYSATMVPMQEIKRISINGTAAGPATINSGEYKYTAPVYAVIRSNLDKNSNAYLFWKWLTTKAGQTAVAKSGYVAYSGHN